LPINLYGRVERAAKREARTVSGMLRVLLHAGLDAREARGPRTVETRLPDGWWAWAVVDEDDDGRLVAVSVTLAHDEHAEWTRVLVGEEAAAWGEVHLQGRGPA
jgi:hypothetical protein